MKLIYAKNSHCSQMEMLLLGGHRMSARKTEDVNNQRKPSNAKVEEDAEFGKIRL